MNKGFSMRILVMMFLFTSCAINMDVIGTRSLSPEIQGHVQGSYSISAMQTTNVRLNPANNSMTNPLEIDHGGDFSLANIELGLMNFIDLVYLSGGEAVGQFGVKLKLFGPSRSQARSGDSSLALFIGGGKEEDEGVNDAFVFSTSKADVETQVVSAGLLYGYRISQYTLIGMSVFYDRYTFKGEFTSSTIPAMVGQKFDYDGKVFNLGLYSIFYTTSGWFTRLEVALQENDWSHTDKVAMGLGAASFGLSF